MSVIGIVCEFNPFHNGHKFLIDSVKKDGDTVVCVMSGNFVQRAEPAIMDKHYRAEAALRCGADIVIELPVSYSVSGAQPFARGAVKLLDSLGVVDTLAFGSECGSVDKLLKISKAVNDKAVHNETYNLAKTGITYASARETAVRNTYGDELADVLHNPNDILAVEYISALKLLRSKMKPVAVKRAGVMHDDELPDEKFASASLIRKMLSEDECVEKYIPKQALETLNKAISNKQAPSDYGKLDIAVLSFLRKAEPEAFLGVRDVSEGIENRIIAAARTASTLQELFDNAKTKRYTHARIRRIVLCAFLGIKSSDTACGMPYIRVLGFTQNGRELLHTAKNTATLPIVMRASDVAQLGTLAHRSFDLECSATDIYNLTLPEIRPCGTEMTDNIIII